MDHSILLGTLQQLLTTTNFQNNILKQIVHFTSQRLNYRYPKYDLLNENKPQQNFTQIGIRNELHKKVRKNKKKIQNHQQNKKNPKK